MTPSKPITLTLFEHRTSPASILVSLDGDDRATVWLPRSQIVLGTERVDAPVRGRVLSLTRIMVTLPEWLAREKGLLTQVAEGQGRLL